MFPLYFNLGWLDQLLSLQDAIDRAFGDIPALVNPVVNNSISLNPKFHLSCNFEEGMFRIHGLL